MKSENGNGNGNTRTFEDKPATRERVPLLIGAMGPSGSGKTYSALRLATGIQRVSGGEIYLIDTESRRSLHYADKFKFRVVEFTPPFGPLDYLAAIEHCVKKGAGVVIVDSMSHEHEGPGGVLEMHGEELDRLSNGDPERARRLDMLAWKKPKSERRRMINSIMQLNSNFIFCFRAKEKLKVIPGKEPEHMGFMPIAGEEFIYEMTAKCVLLPGCNGVPAWQSDHRGERAMMKLPGQFHALFLDPKPLNEDIGEAMAQWAAGDVALKAGNMDEALVELGAVKSIPELKTTATKLRKLAWDPSQRQQIKDEIEARQSELATAVSR